MTPTEGALDPVPRLALTPTEAAQAIGRSRDFFDDHVMPTLRVVRLGRTILIPVASLNAWLDDHAARLV